MRLSVERWTSRFEPDRPRSTMLIAQKSHLTTLELDTRMVDVAVVEQGLLAAMAADRMGA
jgi:hypothetical protein